MTETVLVLVVVGLAAAYLVRRSLRTLGGCGGCAVRGSCPAASRRAR